MSSDESLRAAVSAGVLASEEEVPADAAPVADVIAAAFENLTNGPTCFAGEQMRGAAQFLGSLTRNEAVQLMVAASAHAMGPG